MIPSDPDEAQPAPQMWGETVQAGALLGQRPCGRSTQCVFSARVSQGVRGVFIMWKVLDFIPSARGGSGAVA